MRQDQGNVGRGMARGELKRHESRKSRNLFGEVEVVVRGPDPNMPGPALAAAGPDDAGFIRCGLVTSSGNVFR